MVEWLCAQLTERRPMWGPRVFGRRMQYYFLSECLCRKEGVAGIHVDFTETRDIDYPGSHEVWRSSGPLSEAGNFRS